MIISIDDWASSIITPPFSVSQKYQQSLLSVSFPLLDVALTAILRLSNDGRRLIRNLRLRKYNSMCTIGRVWKLDGLFRR